MESKESEQLRAETDRDVVFAEFLREPPAWKIFYLRDIERLRSGAELNGWTLIKTSGHVVVEKPAKVKNARCIVIKNILTPFPSFIQ
jgi:hypothetical protein